MRNKFSILSAISFLLASLYPAAAGNLALSWNASASTDTAGYNVYYGTTSGTYTHKLAAGNVTSATVSNLTAGVTYYFSATAVDTNGNESSYSNETSFIVPGLLTMSQAASTGGAATMQFPVEPGHWYEVQATTDLHSWSSIWQTTVATSNLWVQFTDPNAASFSARFYRLVLH